MTDMRDIELVETIWDDPSFDPSRFDAVVLGTTWDYTDRPEEFFEFLDRTAAVAPVFNPPSLVRWNADKRRTLLRWRTATARSRSAAWRPCVSV